MISNEEHHLFMESLRQSLPHHSSADSEKPLRAPPPCNHVEDDEEHDKILAEILEALSGPDRDSPCEEASSKNASIDYRVILSAVEWFDAEIKRNLKIQNDAAEKAKRFMIKCEDLLSVPAVQGIMRDNMFLSDLELKPRTFCALERAGVSTVAELCTMSDNDLLGIRRIEQKELEEIKEKLSYYGLCLDDPERDNSTVSPVTPDENQPDEAEIIAKLSRTFDELFGSFDDDENQ